MEHERSIEIVRSTPVGQGTTLFQRAPRERGTALGPQLFLGAAVSRPPAHGPTAAPPAIPTSAAQSPRGWYALEELPHFDGGAIPQSITFRLEGTVPRALLERWTEELRRHAPAEAVDLHRRRVEAYLDQHVALRWLERPDIADIVVDSLRHFDGVRYRLHAWVVMPNHVHAVLTPRPEVAIGSIVAGWKSFTARRANRLLRREGAFWQGDFFDRYVRDEQHFARVCAYVEENPVLAGLCRRAQDWPWSSASRRREIGP